MTSPSDAGPSAIAIAALGDAAAIVIWTDAPERPARRGFRLLLDGQGVPPPATHCSVGLGGARHHLLAVPVGGTRLARAHLQVVALDGTTVAHAERSGLRAPRTTELDMLTFVPELEPRESIRLVRFLLEITPSLFRLGRDESFVAFARSLVDVLSEVPDPLAARCFSGPLAFFESVAQRGIGERLTAVLVGRSHVSRVSQAPAVLPHPKPQRGMARIAVAVDRAQIAPESCLVILGEGGIACRRLPSIEPATSAFERAHRDAGLDLALRDYIVDALVAIDDPTIPTGVLIRELRAATADLRSTGPSGPIAGGVDLVVPSAAGSLVLGWLEDRHDVAEAVTLRRREGDTHHPISKLRRFRHPIADRDRTTASGFILAVPPAGGASLLASVQVRLQLGSGESMVLGDGPSQIDAETALGRALDALAVCSGDGSAPPAEIRAILQALARGTGETPAFDTEEIGRRTADPRIALILPVGTDAELLRCRFAALALEHALAEQAEIVHVVADPAGVDAVAATLRSTAKVYGHGTRLVAATRRCSPAIAINAAVAATTAPVVVLLGSDSMPSGRDWVGRLQGELDSHPRAGLVAARRVAGDGSLIDLGFDRETDADGRMHFLPRLAGFPAAHVETRVTSKVAGSARGAWILRRSLFELVGGLGGDLLSVLGTDLDFCCRVRAAGFELRQVADIETLETGIDAPSARDDVALQADQVALVERWPFRPVETTPTPLPASAQTTGMDAPSASDAEPVASDVARKGKGGKRHARKSRRAA